jgi:hypothetical protein
VASRAGKEVRPRRSSQDNSSVAIILEDHARYEGRSHS